MYCDIPRFASDVVLRARAIGSVLAAGQIAACMTTQPGAESAEPSESAAFDHRTNLDMRPRDLGDTADDDPRPRNGVKRRGRGSAFCRMGRFASTS